MRNLLRSVIAVLFFGSFIHLNVQAQSMLGYHSSNWAGIHNIHFQPADIVDSKYRFDLNLINVSVNVANNYIGLRRDALFTEGAFEDASFQDLYLTEVLNGKDKSGILNIQAQLPSFSITLGPKHAIAFSSRANLFAFAGGLDEDLAFLLYRELDYEPLLDMAISNQDITAQAMGWIDYGLTYGRVLFNKQDHFLKGAVTLKLIQGVGAGSAYSENLDIVPRADEFIDVIDTDVSYGYSDNFNFDLNDFAFNGLQSPVFGGDWGLVYEWRPNITQYTYEMNGREDWLRRDRPVYKLKIGLSMTDLGSVRFTKGGESADFYANTTDLDLREFDVEDFESLDEVLNQFFTFEESAGSTFSMRMPMRFNITADYRVWKGFFLNGTASLAPGFQNAPSKVRHLSQFSLTPRFESKWFGVSMPLSVNAYGQKQMGAGLHVGPLVIGTSDIGPLVGKEVLMGANAYAAVRMPIPYRKIKDRDKDLVSNKMDDCKRTPGLLENNGCPIVDTDDDGIEDAKDACPTLAGRKELNGCPDTDGDQIVDPEDDCPTKPGLKEFNGCPDHDGDLVPDPQDTCPTEAGPKENNGCPYLDTDQDSILDKDDECPEVAGPAANKGCPFGDQDKDSIIDPEDDCPDLAGPVANKGCPYPDTDADGLFDHEDHCPKTFGPKTNNGCPIIEKEEEEVVQTAFENLEFDSGKATIRNPSLSSLAQLAEVLLKKPDYRLKIEGHTDSVGSEDTNLRLSKNRAQAVKDYLVSTGIDADRILVIGHGESIPIANNSTTAGRQQNRRVEMTIVFE